VIVSKRVGPWWHSPYATVGPEEYERVVAFAAGKSGISVEQAFDFISSLVDAYQAAHHAAAIKKTNQVPRLICREAKGVM